MVTGAGLNCCSKEHAPTRFVCPITDLRGLNLRDSPAAYGPPFPEDAPCREAKPGHTRVPCRAFAVFFFFFFWVSARCVGVLAVAVQGTRVVCILGVC